MKSSKSFKEFKPQRRGVVLSMSLTELEIHREEVLLELLEVIEMLET